MTATVTSAGRPSDRTAIHSYAVRSVRELPSQPAEASSHRIAVHIYAVPVVRELPLQPADASNDRTW